VLNHDLGIVWADFFYQFMKSQEVLSISHDTILKPKPVVLNLFLLAELFERKLTAHLQLNKVKSFFQLQEKNPDVSFEF
jgi:hypothetical protein